MQLEKNKLPWGKIVLRRHAPRPTHAGEPSPVRGLDTETLNGYCRLLASSDKNFTLVKSPDDALNFLTHTRYRDTLNFWWNIQYDLEAIVKWLPESEIREFAETGKTAHGDTVLSYIPDKGFKLSRNKHTWTYYDAFQFYDMGLDKAAAAFNLGVKNEEGLDRSLIGSSVEYWREHFDEIITYCIHDAYLTGRLGELLQEEVSNTMGFYPKWYYSKASLSKQYFRKYCQIPDVRKIPVDALRFAFESYKGGRFEVTERGMIGDCTELDINSAYPAEIANLIDVTQGRWIKSQDYDPDAYYGFYLVKLKIPYMHLCPLPRYLRHTVIYPYGEWAAYITKTELENLPAGCRYQLVACWQFYPHSIIYPFRREINHLYEKKRSTPKSSYQYSLYKIIMNSLYGVFYEKHPPIDGCYKTGVLFNPVYASIITANTRVKLYNMALKFGRRTVSLATDGLLVTGDVNVQDSRDLGAWSVSEPAPTIILRTGFYQHGEKNRHRGVMAPTVYHTPYGDYSDMLAYFRDYPDLYVYPILNKRPWHMKELLKKADASALEKINVFEEHKAGLDLNRDQKRVFDRIDLTGGELLTSRIASQPHNLWPNPYLRPEGL